MRGLWRGGHRHDARAAADGRAFRGRLRREARTLSGKAGAIVSFYYSEGDADEDVFGHGVPFDEDCEECEEED